MSGENGQLESELDFDFSQESLLDLISGDFPTILEVSEELKSKWNRILEQTDEWKYKIKNQKETFVKEQHAKLVQKLYAQKTLRLRDKVSFVLGVTYICITGFMMGKYSFLMPSYHFCTIIPLILVRYFIYKSKKWHYFLADLCYFLNVLLMLLFLFPNSRFLYSATFCLTNGPVAWAIYAWRNALVFHSLDKMTSIAIHISPPLTMYAMRWLSTTNSAFSGTSATELWIAEPFLCGALVYMLWQAAYAYFILVQRADKVYKHGHATSFTWLLADYMKNKQDLFLTRVFQKVPSGAQPLLFMLVNFVYALVTSIPTILYYRYFWLHTLFICLLIMVSIFNGADYYIEVFSRRYTIELARLELAAKELGKDTSAVVDGDFDGDVDSGVKVETAADGLVGLDLSSDKKVKTE